MSTDSTVYDIMRDETVELKRKHGVPRKSIIWGEEAPLSDMDLTANDRSVIIITTSGITHSLTHSLTQSLTHSPTHSLTHLQLAKRIFKIMENPGMINNFINDTRHLDAHPGTMNFRHRLEIAQLIHKRNLEMANRLEKIAPVYGYKDLHMVNPLASKVAFIDLLTHSLTHSLTKG